MAKAKKAKAGRSKVKKSKPEKAKRNPAKRAAAAASRGSRKSESKKPKKAARKATKRPAAKVRRKPARDAAAPKKKKRIMGEGDYQASRKFLKDEANFVKRHSADIPQMGKDAKTALDGPQGAELRAAEAEARNHSKAGPEE